MRKVLLTIAIVFAFVETSLAASLLDFQGLGKDRERLTVEQIATRSRLLEEHSDFFLLRDPKSLKAPERIFDPKIFTIIQREAIENNLDPMLLAAIIFVESYGDPLAKSPTGPAGIGQLTKASAKELGLSLSKKVQVGFKLETKTRFEGKGKNRKKIIETKQVPAYANMDERYIPERAIPAIARRLNNRRAWLGGKIDFAIAEYHMGAGRIAKLLSAYFGKKIKLEDIPKTMAASNLTYPQLFWTNTPYFRKPVFEQITKLMGVDFSPTYYFRIQQAMRLLAKYRTNPESYFEIAQNFSGRFGRPILPNLQWSFATEKDLQEFMLKDFDALEGELQDGRLVRLPQIAYESGVKVRTTGKSPIAETDLKNQSTYISAERATIACMMFVANHLRRLQGKNYKGIETNSMVRHMGNQGALVDQKDNHNARTELPTHTFGWAFDLPRTNLTKSEIRDLKFILTDLRYAGLLAFIEEGKQLTFHVVRHPNFVDEFEQYYWQAVATPLPVPVSN